MADRRDRTRLLRWVATGGAAVAIAALVAFPLLELGRAAVSEGAGALADWRVLRAVGNTVLIGFAVAVVALVGGTAAAWMTERTTMSGLRVLRACLMLPLIVPPFVAALGFTHAYGPSGLLDDAFGFAMPGIYGVLGIVTVLGVHAVPLVYVTVAAGLASRAEPDVERAARASGAGALTAFRTVTLPLLRPSLLAGGTLAFVTAVNAFGVPAVLGTPTGFTTVTTLIYADLIRSADPAAFTRVLVLSAGLVALTLAVVAQGDLRAGLAGAVRRTGASAGGATALPRARVGAAAVWVYAVSSAIVPLVGLALMAFTRAVGLPPVPSNLTLDNFKEAVGGIGAPALGRSLVLSVAAATIALGLGALITALRRQRLGGGLGTIVTLTFALPGSALAVAVLLSYGSWLRDTMLLILIAYLAKFWALAQRPLAGAADAIPDDLQRAARASGADAATAVRTVTVPLLRPALAAAWLLVFLFALHEVTISSLLYGPGSQTLAVVVLNLRQLGDVTVTAALSLVLTMLVLAGAGGLALVRRLPSAGGTR